MLFDFRNIKAAVFDFDDTLCIHMSHVWNEEVANQERNTAVEGYTPWPEAKPYPPMVTAVKRLDDMGVKFYLCSHVKYDEVGVAKFIWVSYKYGVYMTPCHVKETSDKLLMFQTIATQLSLRPSQILVVDDLWMTVANAVKEGFVGMSPMEFLIKMQEEGLI